MNKKNCSWSKNNIIIFSPYHYEKEVFKKIRLSINSEDFKSALKILEQYNEFDPSAWQRIDLLKVFLYFETYQDEKAKIILEDISIKYIFKYVYLKMLGKISFPEEYLSPDPQQMKEFIGDFSYDYDCLIDALRETFFPMYKPFISEYIKKTIEQYYINLLEPKLVEEYYIREYGDINVLRS